MREATLLLACAVASVSHSQLCLLAEGERGADQGSPLRARRFQFTGLDQRDNPFDLLG